MYSVLIAYNAHNKADHKITKFVGSVYQRTTKLYVFCKSSEVNEYTIRRYAF